MENQHRKITGYRELSQGEIDLMNKIKAHAVATDALGKEVDAHLHDRYQDSLMKNGAAEAVRIGAAQPNRWLSIARTDFQTGFMALTRAVAQPTTF